ncbi:MAG: phenylalanine--tRNA ligase subunit alpha [Actinobacteria bacterium]|nr:phenylalanine--tRNA ligase subunit alpha [Actinomycetota bacterium]
MKAEEVRSVKEEAIASIKSAGTVAELEEIRVSYLGKKGKITSALKELGMLPAEERPVVGALVNEVRQEIEQALASRREELGKSELKAKFEAERVDITLPGRKPNVGRKHLLTQVTDEIIDIFIGLGYRVAEGPEIELDYYNFEALNTPPDHPARSTTDTFYVRKAGDRPASDDALLRTHTSPVQIRVMEAAKPPIYVIVPGRVYRRDAIDPTHSPVFHQVEGLAVDEKITLGDLKGTLEVFAKAMFGEDREVRLRPHFFPFTEPSAEVDVSCFVCNRRGCRVCGNGWIEILGAGMVDPNVLAQVGYDPETVSGFAFGMGVERIAMLKYGISDMRLFFENDMRFLRQF